MDSKLGEEQKKILGRVPINTWTWPSPSNALLLSRVLGLDSAHPYIEPNCEYRNVAKAVEFIGE